LIVLFSLSLTIKFFLSFPLTFTIKKYNFFQFFSKLLMIIVVIVIVNIFGSIFYSLQSVFIMIVKYYM